MACGVWGKWQHDKWEEWVWCETHISEKVHPLIYGKTWQRDKWEEWVWCETHAAAVAVSSEGHWDTLEMR
jgi:hypothetical protein